MNRQIFLSNPTARVTSLIGASIDEPARFGNGRELTERKLREER